mmetsp:Transcript_6931/g.12416  ORF Transcript_6931/g.12416 Transcript_6931/m.12416 type:complete len:225 (-) Transcript_6931:168-842(-)
MHRSNSRARKHCDGELDNHGHIQRHAVAFLDIHTLENICNPLHFIVHVAVRPHAFGRRSRIFWLIWIVWLKQKRGSVADSGQNMTVDCVVADVCGCAAKPFCEYWLLTLFGKVVLDNSVPFSLPVKVIARNGVPEQLGILDGLLVELSVFINVADVRNRRQRSVWKWESFRVCFVSLGDVLKQIGGRGLESDLFAFEEGSRAWFGAKVWNMWRVGVCCHCCACL